ncbi:MAG: type II toxin-antitoxin system HigB family toxin [Ferruginibacter sp.]|nr:type II toxin-antitoxin system HigB family toxin [Cytophagales bacterium]
MVIIAKSTLTRFAEREGSSLVPLIEWYDFVREADWASLADIRSDFNSVDYVGNDRYVFNIRGNHYRLVVMIHFSIRTVYIKFVGSHQQYDRIDAKTIGL